MRIFLLFFIVLDFRFLSAQTISQPEQQKLKETVDKFVEYRSSPDHQPTSCYAHIGRTLKIVYRVNDFYSSQAGRYMRVDEIYDYLQRSNQWTLIGKGYEQEALTKAQNWANQRRAVVAVYLNGTGGGHLAYVLPGQLSPSGSWGIQVPNSAAFFLNEPAKSYNDKGLSYSFPRRIISKVYLYGRSK